LPRTSRRELVPPAVQDLAAFIKRDDMRVPARAEVAAAVFPAPGTFRAPG